MTHGSLFTGIGGFDLAAQWMGWTNLFQVEIDPFCNKILENNFPDAIRHTDICTFDGTPFRGRVDVVSGGFPCQPYSVAGQRRGAADDRALWPEMLRVLREIQPTWVLCENVAGIVPMALDSVCADLESIGYTCQAFVVPACAIGASHRRDRVWIVAHSDRERQQQPRRTVPEVRRRTQYGSAEAAAHANCARCPKPDVSSEPKRQVFDPGLPAFAIWQPADTSHIVRTAYGLPGRVHSRAARIRALGNSIVPQLAFEFFKIIHLTNTP